MIMIMIIDDDVDEMKYVPKQNDEANYYKDHDRRNI